MERQTEMNVETSTLDTSSAAKNARATTNRRTRHRRPKTSVALYLLIGAALMASGCATTTQPVIREPQDAVDTMRDAFEKNDSELFIHCLAKPVLKSYPEHLLRIGWDDIRPQVGDFVEAASVVEVADYKSEILPPTVPDEFVSPDEGATLKRVTIEVNGERESFLLQQETDPPPANAKQAKGFWIGDRYITRGEHHHPDTYLNSDSPTEDRTHWRLVFPYWPFQKDGVLTRKLQQQMGQETEEK